MGRYGALSWGVMAIRLIAMDLDGTLLDNQGQLPCRQRNAHTVAEAAARGIEIVLVTGRRFDSARGFAGADRLCDST